MKSIFAGLFCLTLATFSVAATTSSEIFQLINERLSYMKDVALFKFRNDHLIEDLSRENEVLEKALLKAEAAGLQPESISGFFQAQMDASKAIQYRYRAEWLSCEPQDDEYQDLVLTVRPKLLQLGDEIVMKISEYLMAEKYFNNNLSKNFMQIVNEAHLLENDKSKIFYSLQRIRLLEQ